MADNRELAGSIMRTLVTQTVADLRVMRAMDLPAIRLSIPLPDKLVDDLGELGGLVASVQAQDLRPGAPRCRRGARPAR